MPLLHLPFIVLTTVSFSLSLASCNPARLNRTTRIPTDELPLPAKTAARSELIDRANRFSRSIEALKLKVSYEFTGGTIETGEIKQWRESEGFILLRKPADIRVIVQAFQVRVIDMVSDGREFSIDVPPKNKFIRGLNHQVIPPRKDVPVNVRPQHIFEALAIASLDGADSSLISVEEDQKDRKKFYILSCHQWSPGGGLDLKRKIWFDRFDLNIVRQRIYAEGGKLETEISYSDFRSIDGQVYPALIHFARPQEAYSLSIRAQKIQVNVNLDDDAFVLKKLPTSEEIDLTREPLPPPLG